MDDRIRILWAGSNLFQAGLEKGARYRLSHAQDGEDCIQSYYDLSPEVLILDQNLGDMDGEEVVAYLREQANDQDIYILALSRRKEDTQRFFSAGANDLIVLPVSEQEFITRLGAAERQVRLTRQLRSAYKRIERELSSVATVQTKLLPRTCPRLSGVELESMYTPSGHASGDYFDYFTVSDHILRLVIADVSGHGGRAAFIMAIVRTMFRLSQRFSWPLTETVHLINKQLCEIIGRENDFVTLFAADVDVKNTVFSYINAGHCPGMLKTGKTIQSLEPDFPVLGFFDLDFQPTEMRISGKCGLFLFTDGLYEWEVEPKTILGLERFWDITARLIREKDFSCDKLLHTLETTAQSRPQYRDDLTAIWVEMEMWQRFVREASLDQVTPLVKEIMEQLEKWIEAEDVLYNLRLVLTESCANVVQHAYALDVTGCLEVNMLVDQGNSVRFEIVDYGLGFDIRDTEVNKVDSLSDSGRGMMIIHELVDSYSYVQEDNRNILYITVNAGAEAWKN